MINPQPDELDEKPLDPQMEKVRRKMVRLLAVSIGIMFIAVMAVLFAIVYKLSRPETAETAAPAASAPASASLADRLALPAGFDVLSVSLESGRIAIFGIDAAGTRRILVYDASSGARIGTIEIGTGG